MLIRRGDRVGQEEERHEKTHRAGQHDSETLQHHLFFLFMRSSFSEGAHSVNILRSCERADEAQKQSVCRGDTALELSSA